MRRCFAPKAAGWALLLLTACSGSIGGAAPDEDALDAQPPRQFDAGSGLGGRTGSGGSAGSLGSAGASGSLGSGGATGSNGSTGSGASTGLGGSTGSGGPSGTGGSAGSDAGGVGGSNGVGGSGGGSVAAWRPFSDASPWNTPIAANATVDPNSSTMITDFSSIAGQTSLYINIQQFSVPVYFVDSKMMPMVTVRSDLGGTGFRTGAANDSAVSGSGPAPIPPGATAADGSDRHLVVVDKGAMMEWGFWDATSSGGTWTSGEASTQDLSGTGVRTPERSSPWWAGHGPRACGFGLIAGLITADELRAGAIEHALVLAYPHVRSRYYTPPASSAQGTTSDAISTRGILCGGRIQLDPTLDVTTLGLSSAGVTIARALQRYGAFIGDFSGAVSIYGDASADARAYFGTGVLTNSSVSRIPLNRFRVLTIGTQYDNMN